MKCIVYTRQNGEVSVVYPAPEYQDQIQMIADKDVPSGIYYVIMDESKLPPRETREAWELILNADNSNGIGLAKEEFEIKYPKYKGMAIQ